MKITPEDLQLSQLVEQLTHKELNLDRIRLTAPTCCRAEPNFLAFLENLPDEDTEPKIKRVESKFPSLPLIKTDVEIIQKPLEFGNPTGIVLTPPLTGLLGHFEPNEEVLTIDRPLLPLPITKYRHPLQKSPLTPFREMEFVELIAQHLEIQSPDLFDRDRFINNVTPNLPQVEAFRFRFSLDELDG